MYKKYFSVITIFLFSIGKTFAAEGFISTQIIKNFPSLKDKIFGIEAYRLGITVFILIISLIITTTFRFLLKKRQKQEDDKEQGDNKSIIGLLITSAQTPIQMVVWAISIACVLSVLKFGKSDASWVVPLIYNLAIAMFIYNIVDIVEYYFGKLAKKTENKLDDMLIPVVRKSLKVLVVIVSSLQIYNATTGKSISTMLAGLGIGGLAFALAAQDTIKNLFGFAMILLDRPFNIGERIKLAGHDGTVEAVGFRSVKIRRLDGHQVVIPNSKVADDVIHNISKRPFIKRAMNISVTYDTPPEKIEKGIEILNEILKDHEGMNPEFPPRVYFNDMLADSLNILVIYWYFPPLYWDYLAFSQKVNLEIIKRFDAEGIEFAFPTQTLFLAGDEKRKLDLSSLQSMT